MLWQHLHTVLIIHKKKEPLLLVACNRDSSYGIAPTFTRLDKGDCRLLESGSVLSFLLVFEHGKVGGIARKVQLASL